LRFDIVRPLLKTKVSRLIIRMGGTMTVLLCNAVVLAAMVMARAIGAGSLEDPLALDCARSGEIASNTGWLNLAII